ncbi:MAG: DUF6702 family protein [Sphingobacteriaceae bacterium]|jgi:hypothetical protein
MRKLIFNSFVILSIFFLSTAFKHPVKLTASLIEYNETKKNLHIETKLFIDDFLASFKKSKGLTIDIRNISKTDKDKINEYFNDDFKISLNKKDFMLNYNSLEIMEQYNVAVFKFDYKVSEINKGNILEVSNTLFFKDFGYIQSNRCTVRIPPFIEEDNYEFTLNGDSGFKKTL